MITAENQAAIEFLDALIATADKAPVILARRFAERVRRSQNNLLKGVRTYPENLPDLPFIWSLDPGKQARARRWYFANKVSKGSKGGRYKRTGELARSWRLETDITPEQGSVMVTTDYRGAAYVVGDYQVPSHGQTGWLLLDDSTFDAHIELVEGLYQDWSDAIDEAFFS